MTRPYPGGRGRSFAPRVDAAEARRAWRALVARAGEIGAVVAAGGEADRAAMADFTHMVVRTGRLAFPLVHCSARDAGEAFVKVARAFVAAGRPEDRAALGGFLAAGARTLEAMFVNDADRAAQVWKGHSGGDL